jgi:hypothetical protein
LTSFLKFVIKIGLRSQRYTFFWYIVYFSQKKIVKKDIYFFEEGRLGGKAEGSVHKKEKGKR